MCGRFTLTEDSAERIARQLGVEPDAVELSNLRPRWNVAPTDEHVILRMKREDRELLPARWGLVPYGSGDAKEAARRINARAETVRRLPAFRNAWRRARRCVVPVDGYFEWLGPRQARQPIWFHRPDNEIFFLAGLYESWRPAPDEWQRTFTIITTEATERVAAVHDRMPVIVPERQLDEWLFQADQDRERAQALLGPRDEEPRLVATAVSPRVNSVRNDDAACLEPVSYPLPPSAPAQGRPTASG